MGDAAPAALLDLLHQGEVDAVLVDHVAVGVRAGDDLAAEGQDLFHRVDGDVAGAGDDDPLALEIRAPRLEHALDEVGGAVAGRLLPRPRAAVGQALAGQHAGLVAVGDALVLTEHVADLAPADADVAGRHIGVFAEMPVQLRHERLAEAHDLGVGAAAGIEVGAALAAADRQAGQRVLEGLLEAEKLDDAEIDRWVEAHPALVGAQRRVELHPEAAVDVDFAAVVHPRHPEDDLPLRLAEALDQGVRGVLRPLGDDPAEALEDLAHGLMEFQLAGVALQDLGKDGLNLLVDFAQGRTWAVLKRAATQAATASPADRRHRPNEGRLGVAWGRCGCSQRSAG